MHYEYIDASCYVCYYICFFLILFIPLPLSLQYEYSGKLDRYFSLRAMALDRPAHVVPVHLIRQPNHVVTVLLRFFLPPGWQPPRPRVDRAIVFQIETDAEPGLDGYIL